MTHVYSFTTRDGKETYTCGQKWVDEAGLIATIHSILMTPPNGVQITATVFNKDKKGDNFIAVSLETFRSAIETLKEESTIPCYHLTSDMLTKLDKTIAVGQVWIHHKGVSYVITEIALDANDAKDFSKAVISYRRISEDDQMVWSLKVGDWLKKVDGTNTPRFRRASSKEAQVKRRNIIPNKSLYQYWKDVVKY